LYPVAHLYVHDCPLRSYQARTVSSILRTHHAADQRPRATNCSGRTFSNRKHLGRRPAKASPAHLVTHHHKHHHAQMARRLRLYVASPDGTFWCSELLNARGRNRQEGPVR
jgi:hypothetical protein